MSPQIATLLFALGIMGLFALNRDRNARTSKALWIPVVWLSIASSRMVSQWLVPTGVIEGTAVDTPETLLEGSPLDRFLLGGLLAISLIVLVRRGRDLGKILRANGPIVLFFFYCAVSIFWSDYPDVAFKRWIKALTDLVMVLIVLTDQDPSAAVKRLLARVGFLLVPISILLNKYYSVLGRGWSRWAEVGFYRGVTTSKTELGGLCMLFGIGSAWCLFLAFRSAGGARKTGPRIAHGVLLAMVMVLFWMAGAMTAMTCFLMAITLITVTSFPALERKRWVVHLLVFTMLSVSSSVLFFGVGSGLMEALGRDPTITGRTDIWNLVLSLTADPLLGTGFESFWLGPRLEKIWRLYWWHPNEAHNGYLEVFLNLGSIGLALLALVVVTGYRNVLLEIRRDPDNGKLRLGYFVIGLAYNFTESAIRIMHPVWIFFLLATVAVPGGWTRLKIRKAKARPTFSSEEERCLEQV